MLVKCKKCEGKGHILVSIGGAPLAFECTTCHGKGGFDVPSNKELCPDCDGAGSRAIQTSLGFAIEESCKTCFGTGFIDKQ